MTRSLRAGDVVSLKGQGRLMTVESVTAHGYATVLWFDDSGQLHREVFAGSALTLWIKMKDPQR